MTDVIKLAEKMAAAALRATPGEWFAEGFIVDDGIGADIAVVSRRTPTVINPEQFDRKANAAFIAIANPLNVEKVTAALKSFHAAFEVWQDKTEWVQTDKRFDVLKPWGMHRADVLKAYIEHLEARIEELESRTAKLPSLKQTKSGERYVWSDGAFNYSQDVKASLTRSGIRWEDD